MNLTKLFQIQKVLDQKIIEKHGLQDIDRLPYLILALQVELGECANEWRGFKFWSGNNRPSSSIHTTAGATVENAEFLDCGECHSSIARNDYSFETVERNGECPACGSGSIMLFRLKNPLLEEYVDCLHFFLSIGISIGHTDFEAWEYSDTKDVTKQFLAVFGNIVDIARNFEDKDNIEPDDCVVYEAAFAHFLSLGKMLGFSPGEIEDAYLAKNKINHERQDTGY
ncbi:dUTP diphosphatase [Shouchella clausii]|uniref:dUTP diphosphatase n=1 Tax=Shouchella clausii TaxID=79880 RepID=UPI00289AF20E|nr:dUTP diphosphatase [Shouchella clausii]